MNVYLIAAKFKYYEREYSTFLSFNSIVYITFVDNIQNLYRSNVLLATYTTISLGILFFSFYAMYECTKDTQCFS